MIYHPVSLILAKNKEKKIFFHAILILHEKETYRLILAKSAKSLCMSVTFHDYRCDSKC